VQTTIAAESSGNVVYKHRQAVKPTYNLQIIFNIDCCIMKIPIQLQTNTITN